MQLLCGRCRAEFLQKELRLFRDVYYCDPCMVVVKAEAGPPPSRRKGGK